MHIMINSFELDAGWGGFYINVPYIGEVCVDKDDVTSGSFLDHRKEGNGGTIWIGKMMFVFNRPNRAKGTVTVCE